MKKLDLGNFGLQEMDAKEMRLENGGFIEAAGLGLAVIAFTYQLGKDLAAYDRRHS